MPDQTPGPVTAALDHVMQGEAHALDELERALRPFLRAQLQRVRRHIPGPLKPRIESGGIINAALKSFLSGVVKKEFPAMQNHKAAGKVLNSLIGRTLQDEKTWHGCKKRNPSREDPRNTTTLPAKSFDFIAWLEDLLIVVGPAGVRLTPVAEFVGWSVLGGKESFVGPGGVVVQDTAGDTILNAKLGVRTKVGCHRSPVSGRP